MPSCLQHASIIACLKIESPKDDIRKISVCLPPVFSEKAALSSAGKVQSGVWQPSGGGGQSFMLYPAPTFKPAFAGGPGGAKAGGTSGGGNDSDGDIELADRRGAAAGGGGSTTGPSGGSAVVARALMQQRHSALLPPHQSGGGDGSDGGGVMASSPSTSESESTSQLPNSEADAGGLSHPVLRFRSMNARSRLSASVAAPLQVRMHVV